MTRSTLAAIAALLLTGTAIAHDGAKGALHIDHPVIRATPAGAPVSGGYMIIRNEGAQADRLLGGSAEFAGRVEVHEMAMDGDVMRMREIEGGIEIPAGGQVTLRPGGLHVMFMQLAEPMVEGTQWPATLTFEQGGDVAVTFTVEDMKTIGELLGKGAGHGGQTTSQ